MILQYTHLGINALTMHPTYNAPPCHSCTDFGYTVHTGHQCGAVKVQFHYHHTPTQVSVATGTHGRPHNSHDNAEVTTVN